MKNKNIFLKAGFAALIILSFSMTTQAQSTDASKTQLKKDSGDGASVKLIDNKGTIKYLQTNNGITSITSTSSGSATTTTWQLGGTLTDNTYIDVEGSAFVIDGIQLVDGTAVAASSDATSLAGRAAGTTTTVTTGTGWTLLIRDEATGKTQKMLATDLMQSGSTQHTAIAADELTDPAITATGISATATQVWVYRNGAKLFAGTEYTVATNKVTIISTGFPIYTDDVFEVQWIK